MAIAIKLSGVSTSICRSLMQQLHRTILWRSFARGNQHMQSNARGRSVLLRTALVVVSVVGVLGCGASSASPSGAPTAAATSVATSGPSDAAGPTTGSSAADTWGPMAVVPPQQGGDTARSEGTLRITETCVALESSGDLVLLVWPEDRTTWDADGRSIAFTNVDGQTVSATDGTNVVVGGSGGNEVEDGSTIERLASSAPWVAAPNPDCAMDSWWLVSALAV